MEFWCNICETKQHSTGNHVYRMQEDLKLLRPQCEACSAPAVVKYDSQGEGYFWLCARKDGDHDDDHYCGVEVARLQT